MDGASDVMVVVGTPDGVRVAGRSHGAGLEGRNVTALAAGSDDWWAITDSRVVWRGGLDGAWERTAKIDELSGECLLAVGGRLFVGASEARLLRLNGQQLEAVAGFDAVEGRALWYTPWGGPADCRSMTIDGDENIYVNVHVGGVVKSSDGGESWRPTGLDIHADAHEVLARSTIPGLIFAAAARGLEVSRDSGVSWSVESDGMHARYCRAVAATLEHVLVSASDGPGGEMPASIAGRSKALSRSKSASMGFLSGSTTTSTRGCWQHVDDLRRSGCGMDGCSHRTITG